MLDIQSQQRQRIIIDCDPGIDDTLALALACANGDKLDIRLISLTHGNTDAQACLKNLLTLMHVLAQESTYRSKNGLQPMENGRPRVAVGAGAPLYKAHAQGDVDEADGWEPYHGVDGLNGYHSRHPDLERPTSEFMALFDPNHPKSSRHGHCDEALNFEPSRLPAHVEIIQCLRTHGDGEVTLLALGPLTNVALAAQHDPVTFSKVKRVVSMGGALRVPGNQTPRAEFNVYGDPDAAALVYNLSSPSQAHPCRISLVPLDITTKHIMTQDEFDDYIKPHCQLGSPLAIFLHDVLGVTFDKLLAISNHRSIICNDPLAVHAVLRPDLYMYEDKVDVRVEPHGLWTRGETVIDGRGRPRWPAGWRGPIRDTDSWLSGDTYNQIDVLVAMASCEAEGPLKPFAARLLEGIFARTR